jgi:hypothetical protein
MGHREGRVVVIIQHVNLTRHTWPTTQTRPTASTTQHTTRQTTQRAGHACAEVRTPNLPAQADWPRPANGTKAAAAGQGQVMQRWASCQAHGSCRQLRWHHL